MTSRQVVAGLGLAAVLLLGAAVLMPDLVPLRWLDDLGARALAAQREHLVEMRRAVRALRSADSWAPLTALLGGAFLYGVLHAIGPGHGKAVIAAYAVADRATLRRGLLATAIASLAQGMSAILLVGLLALILGLGRGEVERWALQVELGATALIALFGLAKAGLAAAGHQHEHCHGHGHGCSHGHHRDDGHDRAQSRAPGSLWAVALAVGIRPCTGAIVLLLFCLTQGLFVAGMLGTLAMSAGTAITVGLLAVAAVYARGAASAIAGDGKAAALLHRGLAVGGWLTVALFGAALFLAAWRAPATSMF
ncbi:nickel/cobalt transporter [Desertibaculum subflavum]|uniref:nickel/cobalt transporter n=1 Tax=Desertibaculum subflavum TaxID=2268458 RepID=UPI0013C52A85